MASDYSSLKIELVATGEQSATWGATTNVNLGTAIEEAITGSADVSFSSANVTLTLNDTNGSQVARNLRLRLTGTTGGARNLIVPTIEKFYLVQNDTADTVTIKNSAGTGVAIPTTMTALVYNDGTNISSASIYSTSIVTPLLAATNASFVNPLPVASGGTGVTTSTGTGAIVRAVSPTLTSPTLTSPTLTTPALGTPTSGVLTSCTGLPLSTGTTGTLGVSNGGTGVTTSTGSGANVLSTSPTLVTPLLGTPTSGVLTSCTGLPLSTGTTGTLGVSNGGTGVTTSTGSGANVLSTSPTLVTPLLGTPTSGVLTNCTGLPLSTGATGTLGVSNGGTGVTTSTGSGANVLSTSPTLVTPLLSTPTLVTPLLGTPTSGTLTNCTSATPTAGDNTTKVATTAFVTTAITAATGSLGTMSTQNAGAVAITGGTITGTTVNGVTVGTNASGTKTKSTASPSGGVDGDIWYKYI